MALTGITKAVQHQGTVSRTFTPSVKTFELGTFSITDFYATIGDGVVTLLKRIKQTPELNGGVFRIAIDEYEYTAAYGVTYVPTDDETATTTPFTLALGEKKGETTYTSNQVLLPDLYLQLDDPLTT